MILITYETRHFEFVAMGHDLDEAMKTLRDGLEKHATKYDLDKDWYADESDRVQNRKKGYNINFPNFVENSCQVTEIEPGQCLRDHEIIE